MIFSDRWPASREDPTLCPECYEEKLQAKAEAARRQEVERAKRRAAIEAAILSSAKVEPLGQNDTAAELAAALGEGPGPLDGPAPVSQFDPDGPEKFARMVEYHRDVASGKHIRFIGHKTVLSVDALVALRQHPPRSRPHV